MTTTTTKTMMDKIYVVMAEDYNPNYPRYFLCLEAAKNYAKRTAKVVHLSSWISEIQIPETFPENGIEGIGKVAEEEYLSDSEEY